MRATRALRDEIGRFLSYNKPLTRPLCTHPLTQQSPIITDDQLSPTPTFLLLTLLSPSSPPQSYSSLTRQPALYPTHLVHFPLRLPADSLYPDGTDPRHLPDPKAPKRMWEGGSVEYDERWQDNIRLDGRRAVCVETVEEVKEGSKKGSWVIDVVRKYGAEIIDGPEKPLYNLPPVIKEIRKLIFLPKDAVIPLRRQIKPLYTPAFSVPYRFSPLALFQFSALSYNAHQIHYVPGSDGFPQPLVHGPLAQALLLHVVAENLPQGAKIAKLTYKNLAPLFANEKLGVHGEFKGETIKVWITGEDGGMAVKGTVTLR